MTVNFFFLTFLSIGFGGGFFNRSCADVFFRCRVRCRSCPPQWPTKALSGSIHGWERSTDVSNRATGLSAAGLRRSVSGRHVSGTLKAASASDKSSKTRAGLARRIAWRPPFAAFPNRPDRQHGRASSRLSVSA